MQDKPLDSGPEGLSVAEQMALALDIGAEWAFNYTKFNEWQPKYYAYTAGGLSLLATMLRRNIVAATFVPLDDDADGPSWSYAMKIAEVHGFDVAEKRFQVR